MGMRSDEQLAALLAVEAALTAPEREELLQRVAAHSPQLRGAQVADVLDLYYDHDFLLGDIEPLWDAHGDELRGGDQLHRFLAIYAAYALAILGPSAPAIEDVRALVARAAAAAAAAAKLRVVPR